MNLNKFAILIPLFLFVLFIGITLYYPSHTNAQTIDESDITFESNSSNGWNFNFENSTADDGKEVYELVSSSTTETSSISNSSSTSVTTAKSENSQNSNLILLSSAFIAGLMIFLGLLLYARKRNKQFSR